MREILSFIANMTGFSTFITFKPFIHSIFVQVPPLLPSRSGRDGESSLRSHDHRVIRVGHERLCVCDIRVGPNEPALLHLHFPRLHDGRRHRQARLLARQVVGRYVRPHRVERERLAGDACDRHRGIGGSALPPPCPDGTAL